MWTNRSNIEESTWMNHMCIRLIASLQLLIDVSEIHSNTVLNLKCKRWTSGFRRKNSCSASKKILFNQGRQANVFEKQSSIFIVKNEKSTTVSLWLSFRSGETSSDRRLYLVNVIRGRVEGKFSRDMGETSAVEHRREQAKEQWVKRK